MSKFNLGDQLMFMDANGKYIRVTVQSIMNRVNYSAVIPTSYFYAVTDTSTGLTLRSIEEYELMTVNEYHNKINGTCSPGINGLGITPTMPKFNIGDDAVYIDTWSGIAYQVTVANIVPSGGVLIYECTVTAMPMTSVQVEERDLMTPAEYVAGVSSMYNYSPSQVNEYEPATKTIDHNESTSNQKHQCKCEFRALLMDGCKCGGV
jgi:hypothetical protein